MAPTPPSVRPPPGLSSPAVCGRLGPRTSCGRWRRRTLRRPIPPSRTCRDATPRSTARWRCAPSPSAGSSSAGTKTVSRCCASGSTDPLRPTCWRRRRPPTDRPLATEKVVDQYLGWTADYTQALEAGMAVTITPADVSGGSTAPRVQPPLRHRGSPWRRPRRAHVAARQPRRHRWPRLPAPGDSRPTTSTTRPPARRTWPTRRSRRQTSIVSGRPGRSWRRRSASRWTRGRRSPEPSTRSVGSHRRSSARRGPGRSATSPTSCSTPSSTTQPWIRPEITPGTSFNRSGRSERCASAASRSACCP